jgi:hypothetical protein
MFSSESELDDKAEVVGYQFEPGLRKKLFLNMMLLHRQ